MRTLYGAAIKPRKIGGFARALAALLCLAATATTAVAEVKETSVADARLKCGDYLLENNVWNIQAAKSRWSQAVYCDDSSGTMGWKWDFSGEHDEPGQFVAKTYPQIIFGKKPFERYSTTTPTFPIELAKANVTVDYDYVIKATGVYNISTDFGFTDSKTAGEVNLRAKLMIWVERKDMPFFPTAKFTRATIDGISYLVMVDKEHDGIDGKWTAIGLLPETFPAKGRMNLKAYIDYLVAIGALDPNWYLSSVEIGTEVSSGKGETRFRKFSVKVSE